MSATSLLPLLLLFPIQVSAPAGELTAMQAALQKRLAGMRASQGFPGATAAVALADGRSASVVIGVTREGTETPLTAPARMLAGSTGKLFVAACALQLVEERVLELDAPISTWVVDEPWFTELPNSSDLTLRHLLRHTSGLPEHLQDPRFNEAVLADPGRTWEPAELVGYLHGAPALFPVGEGWSYADTNYVVVGLVMEKVTGEGYYELLRARLLEPLELQDTIPQDRHDLPGLVPGHTGIQNPFGLDSVLFVDDRHALNPQMEYCGGGVMSTSEDLARFAVALFSGDVLEPATLEQMLDGVPASSRIGKDNEYGLGVILGTDQMGAHRGHSGWFPGYVTFVAWYPDHGLAVAAQVNTDDRDYLAGFPGAWAEALASAVIKTRD